MLITHCTKGANTNWPSEPPALIRPAAKERFSAGRRCAVAPISTEKLPAPAPAAISRPRVKLSPSGLVSSGASTRPATSRSVPPSSTGHAPRWSATAPNTGCTAPQTNCPIASAKLISTMLTPVLRWIGSTYSPDVCRTPMVTIRIAEAATSSPQCMRGAGDAGCMERSGSVG
ncbi:hypothetical protein D9M71_598440 [compost metagenome]